MKKWLPLLLLLVSYISNGQCVKATWVKPFGGATTYESFFAGDILNNGKFLVAGSMGAGTVNLGSVSVTSSAFYSIFLAIHDSAGSFEAANIIGKYNSGEQLSISKLIIADDNSIFICGHYEGSNVELGGVALPSKTRLTIFVARFNSSMQLMWHTLGTQNGADTWANDLTIDLQKNIYITGAFEADVFMFQDSVIQNQGGWMVWSDDAYLLKLDSTGHIRFLRNIGSASNSNETGRTVTADSSGNVLVTGSTSASNIWLKFTDQTGVYVPAGPSQSMFMAKYSGTTGECKWARLVAGFYSSEQIYTNKVIAGENNSYYLCGSITGTIQFAPNTYVSNDQNGYIAKIDSSGNNLWLDKIGGTNSSESATSIFYSNGRIAVSGYLFSNNSYMGAFPLFSLISSPVAYSGLYRTNGELIFAKANASSPSNNISNRVSLIDAAGNLMVWGSFKSTQTWYPVTLTNSSSNYKSFLVKYGEAVQPAFSISAGPDKTTVCGTSVQLSGSTVPSTGVTIGWYPEIPFPGSFNKTPNVNPGMNTTYYLYGTYQGCTLKDTVTVTYTNNLLTVNAGSDISVCSGDSMQITTTVSDPSATFTWTPSKYINTTTSQNPWVKSPLTTNYIVTATLNGCKATDTVRVISNPKPYIFLPKQDFYSPYWRYHLCSGSNVDINMGDPMNTYNILTPSLVTNVNNNLATILGSNNGLLKVTATSQAGCVSRDSVNVIVHQNQTAPPILQNLSNRSACPGDSINFYIVFHNSSQYTYQYSWYSQWQVDSLDGNGWQDINLYDPGYETFNASYGFPGSTYTSTLRIWNVGAGSNGYKYRATIRDYCSPRSYSNTATLNVGPKITAHPLTRSFCQNATDSIFANSSAAGVTYEWEIKQNGVYVPFVNQPGVLVANGRFLRIVNAQSGIDGTVVRCKLTGCSPTSLTYTDSAIIKVVSIPVVVSQATGGTICSGVNDSLYVNVNGGPYTYQWYANGNPITYNTSQVSGYNTRKLIFTPVWPSQNNVVYTCKISNASCGFTVFSDTAMFVVNSQPVISVSPVTQSVCVSGGTGVISASGGDTYTWGPASGLNVTTGAQVTASPSSSSTYTVTGTSTNGCSATATAIVNTTTTISVTLSSSANSVCQGSSVTLTAGGASSYSWSPSSTLSSSTGSVVDASPMNSTAYTVTGTNGLCTGTAVKTITSLPSPNINVTPSSASLCEGSSTTLSVSGAPYYSWSPGSSLSSTTSATVTATPLTTTTYTITGTNYQNCRDIKYIPVQVNSAPVVIATALTDTLCMGSSTVLSASGASSYNWFPGTGLNSTTGSSVTASPISTQTYTITGSNGGCTSTTTLLLKVVPGPGFTIGGSLNQICEGSSSVLTATNSTHSYEWSPATGLSSTSGVSVVASPLVTTTYSVTGTNTYGCTAVRNFVLNVNSIPVVSITATDDTICEGESVLINANGATTYTWFPTTGLSSSTGDEVTASPNATITYTLTGANGTCTDEGTVILEVLPVPMISWQSGIPDTVCLTGVTYILENGLPAGGTYSGAGTTGNTFDPGLAGQGSHMLYYSYTDPLSGCEGTTGVVIYVDVCSEVRSAKMNSEIVAYQRNDEIYFKQIDYFHEDFSVSIYNGTGELLMNKVFNRVQEGTLETRELANGIYFVSFADKEITHVLKVAIVK